MADAARFVPAPAADGFFVHADHLGSPQAMTDDAQQEVWRIDTRPFGEVEALTWSVENNQRFPGQYADAESGYSYNYFRDYDPTLGRYLQSDPIGLAGGINSYAYVGGNPVGAIDPTGLFCRKTSDGILTCYHERMGRGFSVHHPYESPDTMDPNSFWGHTYYHRVVAEGVSESEIMEAVRQCPTPGVDNEPATPYGTLNDATPSDAPLEDNWVESYFTKDQYGRDIMSNVTLKDHWLYFGFVEMFTSKGPGGVTVLHIAGEGTGELQSKLSPWRRRINDVWIDYGQDIIKRAQD